jgi:hypothetical protein
VKAPTFRNREKARYEQIKGKQFSQEAMKYVEKHF